MNSNIYVICIYYVAYISIIIVNLFSFPFIFRTLRSFPKISCPLFINVSERFSQISQPLIKHRAFRRSSHPEVFCKKGVLKNFVKSPSKHLLLCLFLIKLQASGLQLYLKKTQAQVFSCEFCEISRMSFYIEHLW